MTKRSTFENATCPIARATAAVGDTWSILIIRDALLGVRRFGEFQRNISIAKNILTNRLKALTSADILEATPASDGSAYLEYRLTPKGRALFPIMVALRQWAEEYAFAPGELSNRLVDRASGRPVRKLELRDADGRLLEFGDTAVAQSASAS